jgi:hypothetical protein
MPFDLKDYEPVEDRLREFWSDHPKGRIHTELVHAEDGDYIVKALVYLETYAYETSAAATGYAHDSATELPANMKASALEVCETSAIGRALANLGYAAKGKRPSREEMSKTSPAKGEGIQTDPATAPGQPERVEPTGSPTPAGDTSSASLGEVGADTKPGEGRPSHPSSGFPIDPAVCTHKFPSGGWVRWVKIAPDFTDRCPKCGTSKLVAMEGTNADLGPA